MGEQREAGRRPVSELFTRLCEMALAVRGGLPINVEPGAWSYQFTDALSNVWRVAVNGHKTPMLDPFTPTQRMNPFDAHLYYNGWPFAVINPYGEGVVGRGEGANEDSCIAALEAQIARHTTAAPDA